MQECVPVLPFVSRAFSAIRSIRLPAWLLQTPEFNKASEEAGQKNGLGMYIPTSHIKKCLWK